ncbi:MAG TPA: VOC family protein [Methylocystis sp.]|nr:VOC family protein [Methylocystis sp.]
MRIGAVRVFVDDLEAARRFYADTLGLKPLWDYKDIAIGFDVGQAPLIVELVGRDADPEDDEVVGRFVGLSLQVDDISAVYADLSAKGVRFLGPPERQDWGGILAHFRDSSNNVLTLLGFAKD